MKIYLSGPISGIKDNNKHAFNFIEEELRALGHDVVNPIKLDITHTVSNKWEEYMKRDIKYMLDCDMLVMLPNWINSKGARLEVAVAKQLDIPIYRLLGTSLVKEKVYVDVELAILSTKEVQEWDGHRATF